MRAAVGAAAGETPVVAPAGYGTALAIELAKDAAGADALLLLPPYLTEAGQDGLVAHVRDGRDRPARRPGTAA
ncbi:dihydrodipicolinate synthase family protein, partial [Actinomadura sp. HBU206391]|uniref:dihydrodipicolinate synthase family protein n=1 Tax=Actinomadura sp. HBU206391 TaxID=2731692 RepID=UPI00164F6514